MCKIFSIPSIAVFTVLIFSYATADDGIWNRVGAPSAMGTIVDISIGYEEGYGSTRYVFAAESSSTGILRYTTDDGITWMQSYYTSNHYFKRTAIESSNFHYGWSLVPSISGNSDQYAGPYRTADRGIHWERKDNGLDNNKKLEALAICADPSLNPSLATAYIGCEGNSQNGYQKLFKTTNGGETWQLSQTSLPAGQGIVHDLAIRQDQPNIMYCAYEGSGGGLYRSTDGGATWSQWIFDPLHPTASAHAVAARFPLTHILQPLYFYSGNGICTT